MRTLIHGLTFAALASLTAPLLGGCTADVHDNTADIHDNNANIENAKVDFDTDADMNNVTPGQSIHVTIRAEDVYLVAPSDTPPPDRVQVAGYFEFFLDSTSSQSLLVTAAESVDIVIPSTTTPGPHKLICRIDKHDGTPTQATFDMDMSVSASVSIGAD